MEEKNATLLSWLFIQQTHVCAYYVIDNGIKNIDKT